MKARLKDTINVINDTISITKNVSKLAKSLSKQIRGKYVESINLNIDTEESLGSRYDYAPDYRAIRPIIKGGYNASFVTYEVCSCTIFYVIFKDKYHIKTVRDMALKYGYDTLRYNIDMIDLNQGIYWRMLDNKTFVVASVEKKKGEHRQSDMDFMSFDIYFIGINAKHWKKYYDSESYNFGYGLNKLYKKDNIIKVSRNDRTTLMDVKPLDKIILTDNERIVIDKVDQFLRSREIYKKYNIPYRYGIILYGKPGTGKTALATSIASHFNMNLKVITKRDVQESVTDQHKFVRANNGSLEPMTPYLTLFDEIDGMFDHGTPNQDDNTDYNSGILEAPMIITKDMFIYYLDHMIGPNSIIIGTTNHVERLFDNGVSDIGAENSLLRPGRFDLVIEMKYFDKDSAIKMIESNGLDKSFADNFEYPICPAVLQSKIIDYIYEKVKP